jgi:hypothetical protein
MLDVIYDPVLYRIEQLFFQNIPYYVPDTNRLSWMLFSRKVDSEYQFQIYGRECLFGRKLLATIRISGSRVLDFHIYKKTVQKSQRDILESVEKEITYRLTQIPIFKGETNASQ